MNSEVLIGQPYDFVKSDESTANADVSVTQAAPDANKQHIVQGIIVSSNKAIVASVKAELIQDAGGTPSTLMHFRLPEELIKPIFIPLKGVTVAKGKSITLKLPAGGANVILSGTIVGMTRFSNF